MIALAGNFHVFNGDLALDGSGNLYIANKVGTILKLPTDCLSSSCVSTITLFTSGDSLGNITFDGAGNLYAIRGNSVLEFPLGCTSLDCAKSLGGGFREISGIAVNAEGDVYITAYANYNPKKVPAGCTSADCVLTFPAYVPGFKLVLDASENIYSTGNVGDDVLELLSGSQYTTVNYLDYFGYDDDEADYFPSLSMERGICT